MSLPLNPRYILLWRKQMVTVLPGCAVRNFCVAKAIFYLIGNAEMGWEFHSMSTEEWRLLSEESTGTRKKCFAISLQHCASALSGETVESGSSGAKFCARGEREIPPEGPMPAAAWLCGWTRHARQRQEDICSMTQCRVLGAKAPKQIKWASPCHAMRLCTARVRKHYYSHAVIHEP